MAKVTASAVLKPAAILVAVCVVISAALAVTNSFTSEKIAWLEKQQSVEAMKSVFDIDGAAFAESTVEADGKAYEYSTVSVNGERVGYVFTVSENGYGGEVKVMTGVNADGTVRKISVLSVADETPGLGQNAAKTDFTEQFEGKSGEISTEKNKDVDAVTGATITTTAVIKNVNTALKLFEMVKGE